MVHQTTENQRIPRMGEIFFPGESRPTFQPALRLVIQFQMVSPEDTEASDIIQTDQDVLVHLGIHVHMYSYMCAQIHIYVYNNK